jgi:N-acetylmuramoyl-L-alanine amidase
MAATESARRSRDNSSRTIMLTSLLHEARLRPAIWRRRLAWYWRVEVKEHLPFLAMIALPIVSIAGIVYFACAQEAPTAPANIENIQRETRRALRREGDLQCLAENVYFEARGEPTDGQFAVAEVTLNRTRAEHFPHTICAVVHESRWDPGRKRHVADFSWTELGDISPGDGLAWKRAMTVASAAYDDERAPVVPGALFYHATNVRPAWAKSKEPLATIGHHVFYR